MQLKVRLERDIFEIQLISEGKKGKKKCRGMISRTDLKNSLEHNYRKKLRPNLTETV